MRTGFWALIDQTRPNEPDPAAHAEAITKHLVESGVDATLEYASSFDRAMDALYTWDLWGAAYMALGGCSDDAFEYMRAWLVGQGETIWAMARDDPERLFLRLLDEAGDPASRWDELGTDLGEVLLYSGGRAHETLTGQWLPPRADVVSGPPAGADWDEGD
ncbi:MAG: DUF4240 domain-containing protein, partial [Acidimicrobiia bacterium]